MVVKRLKSRIFCCRFYNSNKNAEAKLLHQILIENIKI